MPWATLQRRVNHTQYPLEWDTRREWLLAPDLTQPRTVTRYDGLGRSLGTVTYSNATAIIDSVSTTYSVAQGLPGFTVDTQTPFERVTAVDAYNHQQITYSDGFGNTRYSQDYSGVGSPDRPYQTYRTIQSNYDPVANITSTNTYNQNSNKVAYRTSIYDGTNELVGWNDADSGSCTNTPMPASCSNSSDTAWKVSYDNNGNQTSLTDPRGQTTYASYDSLDRMLCKEITRPLSAPVKVARTSATSMTAITIAAIQVLTSPVGVKHRPPRIPSGIQWPRSLVEALATAGGNGYDARSQDIMDTLSVTSDNTTTTQTVSKSYDNAGSYRA